MARPAQNITKIRRPNRTATRRTVRAMRDGGRLEGIDQSAVAAALTSADLLDEAIWDPDVPAYAKAQVLRAHLAAVAALTGKENADVDEGIGAVIAALSTPLGDTATT
jgi:succinylarginine dihydrolase